MVCWPKQDADPPDPESARFRGMGEKVNQVGTGVAVGAGRGVSVGWGVTVGWGVGVGSGVSVGILAASAACAVCVADGPERLAGLPPPKGEPPLRNISVPPPQRLASRTAATASVSKSLPGLDEPRAAE